jgi:hypothetical protein
MWHWHQFLGVYLYVYTAAPILGYVQICVTLDKILTMLQYKSID